MDRELLEMLRKAVDFNWERQVCWLQTLVRFPSLRGNESTCQDWLVKEFEGRGWSVDRYSLADVRIDHLPGYAPLIGVDPARLVQAVATIAPVTSPDRLSRVGKSLILQGHVDVVPTGPEEMWTGPPFSGSVEGEWLCGRGAQDMKMGISALVFALDAIRTAKLDLAAPVYLQTVTEEESTGNGALSTLARGYTADACLIPEPTANTITRAQSGALWFKLKIRGKPVHVEKMQSRNNAIFSTFSLIDALQALTQRLNVEAKQHRWFKDVIDPIKFNPGIIRGGDWASSTPSWCEVDCRIGVLPGTPVEDIRRAVIDTVTLSARDDAFLASSPPLIEWNGFQAEGAVLEPGSEAERVLEEAHFAVFGAGMKSRLSNAVNDTRYYNLYQRIPALCYGPAGEGLHGFDERANLPSLKQTTLVIAAFIAAWCVAHSSTVAAFART